MWVCRNYCKSFTVSFLRSETVYSCKRFSRLRTQAKEAWFLTQASLACVNFFFGQQLGKILALLAPISVASQYTHC